MPTLEERIKILEDIEEIKKLKARYCYAVDEKRWDDVLDCFSENASADYAAFGKYPTKKDIEKFFKEIFPKACSFCLHMVHNPIIEVDGDKASGRWYFDVPLTMIEGNQAVWLTGMYEEEYIRENGKWKYLNMKCTFFYMTPYEEGWAKKRMMSG